MQQKIILSFLILTLVTVFPQVTAQSDSTEKASQKLVEITLDLEGNVKVTHQINNSNEQVQLELVKGTVSNLEIINELGERKVIETNNETKSILIAPNQGKLTVQYDLDDELMLKNNIWTLDYRYLQRTNFFFPDELGTIFTNGVPANLNDKKGLACHGCQILLEYSVNEPKNIRQVNLDGKEFLVEIITFVDFENFSFNQNEGEINFQIKDENQFVTTIIPIDLLWEPYSVLLDNEKIDFHDYINNGTHVWIKTKPTSSGEITINGTTTEPAVDPKIRENTLDSQIIIIIISIVGILAIIAIFLVRKFSRR